MPSEVMWKIQSRVMFVYFSGHVVAKDLVKARDFVHHYLRTDGAGKTVHIIADNTHVEKYGVGMDDIRKSILLPANSSGWVVVISPQNLLIRTLTNFFTVLAQQISGGRYRYVESYEQAVAFLRELDATLNFPDEQAAPTDSPHYEGTR
ncbi:MAG: hypothetical protein K8I82_11175 [Anaerolineae bacterium]|nr:hypothetical protein [Anaerolineae bacterium]